MSSIHLLLSLTVIPRQCMRSEARPASRDAWFSGKPDCTDHANSSASSVGYRVHISPHVCVHPRMCAQCRRAGACFADASAIGARKTCLRFYTIDAECIEDHDTPRESSRKNTNTDLTGPPACAPDYRKPSTSPDCTARFTSPRQWQACAHHSPRPPTFSLGAGGRTRA